MNTAFGLITAAAIILIGAEPQEYFRIDVVDESTGRGVPLVELTTVNGIQHLTDSAGVIAFHEPGLMGRDVFFYVRSHGYELPSDGFGYRGRRLKVQPGGQETIKIKRTNIAERLYRVTGAGIYRESILLGDQVPASEPLLNALVLGSDSVVNAVYRGRIHWFWGDTNRPNYPLGNFHVPGATSSLPPDGGLDPAFGVNLRYFQDTDGFAKPTCRMPGTGPTWIDGLITLKENARERLFAHYVKIKPPLTVYENGLAEFNDQREEFEHVTTFADDAVLLPGGHPFLHTDDGTVYAYFAKPYPLVRVAASAAALAEPAHYESWTYFKAGSTKLNNELERDSAGKIVWGWKRATLAPNRELESKLVKSGQLRSDERFFTLSDVESSKSVVAHGGSVYWNDFRKRWVMVFVEHFGTSLLGEVWYSEADTLTGPWKYARKVVTHDKYSFYNPKQHPMFDQDGGRIIYFEGTYTHTFSGNPVPTPRYDYNQIMYRLDLSDERLHLP